MLQGFLSNLDDRVVNNRRPDEKDRGSGHIKVTECGHCRRSTCAGQWIAVSAGLLLDGRAGRREAKKCSESPPPMTVSENFCTEA
jgi:hypothetical protein